MTDSAADDATEGDAATDVGEALLSRLRLIEDQPIEGRAAAYVQVHDELRRALEGADAPAVRD
jgi:hypothetical protein